MGEQQMRPPRRLVCAVAALLGALIVAEPLVIDVKPSLQIFQSVIVIWLWALFMFGGASHDTPTKRR